MRWFVLILFFFLADLDLQAATKSAKKLSDKLNQQSHSVTKLAAQIKDLDNKLSLKNNEYIDRVKKIEAIEAKVSKLQSELSKSAEIISKDYNNSQKALNLYLLELSDEDNEDRLQHQKIYLEVFKNKFSKLKKAQQLSNQLLETINLYDQKLTETKSNEEIIYNLIIELENKKKEMSQDYISKLESKNMTEASLDKIKAKKRAYKKVFKPAKSNTRIKSDMLMDIPLEKFISAKKSRKGIILKFNQMTPVKAPSPGKIVYTGELANYGQVIMIDHGNDVKSVIFGDIKIKTLKGELVQKSQIIGYTLADPGIEKSLYYEIRRKNIAQNTVDWISSNYKENITL